MLEEDRMAAVGQLVEHKDGNILNNTTENLVVHHVQRGLYHIRDIASDIDRAECGGGA